MQLSKHHGPEVTRAATGGLQSIFGIHLLEPGLVELMCEPVFWDSSREWWVLRCTSTNPNST